MLALMTTDIRWLSTKEAADRLGITPRTLYRFIDEGSLPAYRFGRVIRLQEQEVIAFIDRCRIQPGSLEHLYPDLVDSGNAASDTDSSRA
jgi:excisionase family DNA binding protein